MSDQPRILFHVGGPRFHPVDEQAAVIQSWLGDRYGYDVRDGADAFDPDVLDACDLLVLMGLHWTGMTADWAGRMTYRPPGDAQKDAFEAYVRSGRPILAHHGAIASYDDWPRFGQLVGFAWVWGETTDSPFGTYTVRPLDTGHPVIAGVGEDTIEDELYYNVKLADGLDARTHAVAAWDGQDRPMVMTAAGGRVDGAGRVVYLANGHDLRAFACPAMRTLWTNTLRWLLD